MIRRRIRLVPIVVRACVLALIAVFSAGACSSSQPPAPKGKPTSGPTAFLDGAPVFLQIGNGVITKVLPASAANAYIVQPVIDSHVHVTYWDIADKLPQTGIAAVVDLAAPERALGKKETSGLVVVQAGPMLTRPDGYPLDEWGSDGYGIGCADEAAVTATVERLHKAGARVVKVALDGRGLDPKLVPAAVKTAHARQMKVAVHALSDASAALAAEAGADLLAHTPVEPLRPETVAAWKGRAVISSLAAFGGSDNSVANLKALRAAGATVLYGTDMGNLRDAGPSEREILLLKEAGLDDAAILAAMTTTPATYWGLPFGKLAVDRDATFLVLARDPTKDVLAILRPVEVWSHGERRL